MKTKLIKFPDGETGNTVDLNKSVFGLPVRKDVLHACVRWQLAKRRAGTHSVRTVSEIRGTTAKPYRQKGTGNARQGSHRSLQFRGGGTYGPKPRSHAFKLPKKTRKLALKTALSSKLADEKLFVVADLEKIGNKTKELHNVIKKLGWNSVLIIGGNEVNDNVANASSNLKYVNVLPQIGANVYDILRHENVVLTQEAVNLLEERLQ